MEFFTVFSPCKHSGTSVEGKSLTQQQFKDECDVNVLIKRFADPDAKMSLRDLSVSGSRMPFWGDFTSVPDVQTAQGIFSQADAAFRSLPADVRLRFGNDPVELLRFTEDPANRDEVLKLFGVKPAPVDPVIPKADTVATVNADVKTES